MAAHGISGVTVITDAGMMGEVEQAEIEAAGLEFMLGAGTA